MFSATNEIKAIRKQIDCLLEKEQGGRRYLPQGVKGRLCAASLTLNGAVHACEEHDKVSSLAAEQPGGMDHSLPVGDR